MVGTPFDVALVRMQVLAGTAHFDRISRFRLARILAPRPFDFFGGRRAIPLRTNTPTYHPATQGDTMKPVAERRGYTHVFNALSRISSEEGSGALYKGLAPNILRCGGVLTQLISARLGSARLGSPRLCSGGNRSQLLAARGLPNTQLTTQHRLGSQGYVDERRYDGVLRPGEGDDADGYGR